MGIVRADPFNLEKSVKCEKDVQHIDVHGAWCMLPLLLALLLAPSIYFHVGR